MIEDWISDFHPVTQALFAGVFTWLVTAAGAATVFATRTVTPKLLHAMLGFAGGVMIAASFWSLLAPAIDIASAQGTAAWLPAAVGFLLGGAVLWSIDKILPHLHPGMRRQQAEGPSTSWKRSVLLVLAITLHNIPEGLAVGVAFGGVVASIEGAGVGAAVALAIGIGLQNFPEGIAVAMPLREELGRVRSFMAGQLSGIVEPIAAVVGAAAVIYASPILAYALAFAAGAMIYVVAEELIPEAERSGNVNLATVWLMIGFVVMMCLDVGLG